MSGLKELRFWMVYSPTGGAPTRSHYSRDDAQREAERLARNNPGRAFFVLKSVGGACCEVSEPVSIKMRGPFNRDENIPF